MNSEKPDNPDDSSRQPPPDPGAFTQEVQHQQISARVPERVARGVFSTGAMIFQGPHEFVVDFVLRMAALTPGVLPGMKSRTGATAAGGEDFIGPGAREVQNSISLKPNVGTYSPTGRNTSDQNYNYNNNHRNQPTSAPTTPPRNSNLNNNNSSSSSTPSSSSSSTSGTTTSGTSSSTNP